MLKIAILKIVAVRGSHVSQTHLGFKDKLKVEVDKYMFNKQSY